MFGDPQHRGIFPVVPVLWRHCLALCHVCLAQAPPPKRRKTVRCADRPAIAFARQKSVRRIASGRFLWRYTDGKQLAPHAVFPPPVGPSATMCISGAMEFVPALHYQGFHSEPLAA
jgi:hypothetical protein